MSRHTVLRLTSLLCAALIVALIVQLVGDYDFRGLPFLYFGVAVAVLGMVAVLSNLKHKPVGKPE